MQSPAGGVLDAGIENRDARYPRSWTRSVNLDCRQPAGRVPGSGPGDLGNSIPRAGKWILLALHIHAESQHGGLGV